MTAADEVRQEWGIRYDVALDGMPAGFVSRCDSAADARRWVREYHPHETTVVTRFVSPWLEVPGE